ncbi:hypothetical protein Q7P37_008816 [Cladosporium fusiforme]
MAPKRKRAGTLSKDDPTSEVAAAAPPSNNAAPEVADDAAEEDTSKPAKRTRSSKPAEETNGAAVSNGTVNEAGEHGEAGKMRMAPPPKAGAVDPQGGYMTNPPPTGRSVRVYADGVFDLFHLGHMRQLQQAKEAFPGTYLIVGVTGDEETHKRKGLTVLSAKERAESVRHCRWVDEVVEDCPWVIDVDFLAKHNIDYVAHDDIPYGASEGDDIYKPIKEQGKFLVTQRTEGVSTTGIITKVVRDYEQYIARQFKRGTSRQELNVSWLKKNELDIKRHVGELRDNIRSNWATTGQELSRELKQFWQPSRNNSPAPSLRSTTPGRLSASGAKSPLSERLNPLDIARAHTPGGSSTKERGGKNYDFAAGYAMGLIGGVKGWMQGSNRRNLSDSRAPSPNNSGNDEDDSPEAKSPIEETTRGRRGRPAADKTAAAATASDTAMDSDAPSEQLVAETKDAGSGRL